MNPDPDLSLGCFQVVQVGQTTADLCNLLDEGQVMYALGRYETKFDMSTTVKFVYFRWSVNYACLILPDLTLFDLSWPFLTLEETC